MADENNIKRRSPRKLSELNNPKKSAGAEENRLDKKFQARVSPDFFKKQKKFREENSLGTKTLTEDAINYYIDHYDEITNQ